MNIDHSIRHNIFFERKMRIAVYNLQCTVCYIACNDHIKTEL